MGVTEIIVSHLWGAVHTVTVIPAVGPGEAGDTDKTASASPDNRDNLVALVLARPEINSLSDLNNKNIAIEEKQSAARGSVSAAPMAAAPRKSSSAK